MNHLAHALLADGADTEFALGSALGDFVRGPPDPAWAAARRAGLRFHRAIDRFTDTHREVIAARALFASPLRRYAGILVDVWFDHLLARQWPACATLSVDGESLSGFSRRWLALLDAHTDALPGRMRDFLAYIHVHDLPAGYREEAVIDEVLRGIGRRLSRPNPLHAALPALRERAAPLRRHFDAFFPGLVQYARRERGVIAPATPST